MKAKTFLARAYRLDLKINTKLEQLEYLRSLACKVTGTLRQDKVSSGTPSKGTLEGSVIKIVTAECAINNEIDRLIEVKNEISDAIRLVANEEQRLLLELRYLCFNSWEQIAVKMGYSCSYVYNTN
jgi:hypothetical protein